MLGQVALNELNPQQVVWKWKMPMKGKDPKEIRYVVALSSMAPVLARMWKSLIEEESPPLMEAGPQGEEACSRAVAHMLEDTDRCISFIALSGTRPIGFILGYTYNRPYGHPACAGQILHWYVAPGFRGEGVGHYLYDQLMGWFQKKNVEIVEVMALDDPERDKRWRSRGFSVTLRVYAKRLSSSSRP
ncbi:MAG: GNAT family N-acetyltransferase [Leptospirales bacterium]